MSESTHNKRKRDDKLNQKELDSLQRAQLEQERERYDHQEIDEQNQEFLKAAKQKRKLHRRHEDVKGLEGESDVDEEFKVGLDQAAGKFGVKRKKKHLFNDAGIPFEPFNLENDIKEGVLTREGVYKMEREQKAADEDEEQDAWYESIKGDQEKMLYMKSQRAQDSDASESADDDGDSEDDDYGDEKEVSDTGTSKASAKAEKFALKKELIEILQNGETANKAMQRLKGTSGIVIAAKKKNVRSTLTPSTDVTMKAGGDKELFDKLLGIATRLQDLGYTDVFTERREDIAHEVRQEELIREREEARIAKEVKGWHYKIMNKEDGSESGPFGPFTQDQMEQWNLYKQRCKSNYAFVMIECRWIFQGE